jgi:hypothetical protein
MHCATCGSTIRIDDSFCAICGSAAAEPGANGFSTASRTESQPNIAGVPSPTGSRSESLDSSTFCRRERKAKQPLGDPLAAVRLFMGDARWSKPTIADRLLRISALLGFVSLFGYFRPWVSHQDGTLSGRELVRGFTHVWFFGIGLILLSEIKWPSNRRGWICAGAAYGFFSMFGVAQAVNTVMKDIESKPVAMGGIAESGLLLTVIASGIGMALMVIVVVLTGFRAATVPAR